MDGNNNYSSMGKIMNQLIETMPHMLLYKILRWWQRSKLVFKKEVS